MDLKKSLGFRTDKQNLVIQDEKVIQYINLKLSALGLPVHEACSDPQLLEVTRPLLSNHRERSRMLSDYACPADSRIQDFLNDTLKAVCPKVPGLPSNTFILDRQGIARKLSLPPDQDSFISSIVSSYRIKQGILHNPQKDRRTTQGVFHVVEGGLPVPDDKKAVPKKAFARLLEEAFNPPEDLLRLPFTSSQKEEARVFVSLLLRPIVSPEVPGYLPEKTMEIRFFAPGSLVSNLDFVESIFGNGGDPYLPENDASLDTEHWTGHTGCVVLAPHLTQLRKKDLGLPHHDQATERQRQDGMCWEKEEELYNDGEAFKATCRDERGIMVTLIADNYFGYCKKEVKTQISFSSNLFGLSEEEHAGGAIAFPSYDLGEKFQLDDVLNTNKTTFDELAALYGEIMDIKPEGYGVDKNYSDVFYVPADSLFNIPQQTITWTRDGKEVTIRMRVTHTYMLPSGYKIHAKKQTGGRSWHLTGTTAEGTLCHKPCTVSGGGKSEISKSIVDAMIQAPVFTADFYKDMDIVAEILRRDFGGRFKNGTRSSSSSTKRPSSRPILSPKRSLGSVIKLFTPSSDYTDDYNAWIESIAPHVKDMIFVVKRYYRKEWGDNWRDYFSVDVINGHLGHELKYSNQELLANYLRVGHEKDGSWRIYRVRQDFSPAQKVQVEDDITASITIPSQFLRNRNPQYKNPSVKLVTNCEYRLFQRPDDAIIRGYDKQTEKDLSSPHSFLSNFHPLTPAEARDLVEDTINFELYTPVMRDLIEEFVENNEKGYVASSAHPRIVEGKPTKNPRYLQDRPDLVNARHTYIQKMGTRIYRRVPLCEAVFYPVNAVLPGRRMNPPETKNNIPPLAVYNPIHYQELPELFMDFVASVTGKSPSTTGFGSEGALTKGPFNALWPVVDLNNALLSFILTEYDGFISAAGHIGPNVRVDHDISLLVPELWSRMSVEERNPEFLIANGYLEKLEDFEHGGRQVRAGILGYRITLRFVHAFFGRIFSNPNAVFAPSMLRPELQDMDVFSEGMDNLFATLKRVAEHYFNDGSVEAACPPLKALLHIMDHGNYEGRGLNHPDIRRMFTREYLMESEWYQERLKTKQARDIALYTRHIRHLESFVAKEKHSAIVDRLGIRNRLQDCRDRLNEASSPSYLEKLTGTIGADPFHLQLQIAGPQLAVAGK